tara:strand:+ start:1121 stop:1357 length:237 start_codon:yes stop_codon:yes gene_type:complete
MEKETEQKENIRVFVDLNVTGNANGGVFIRSDLKETVDEIEKSGETKVVGVVYDETYNLEILTQPRGLKPAFKMIQDK